MTKNEERFHVWGSLVGLILFVILFWTVPSSAKFVGSVVFIGICWMIYYGLVVEK